MPVTQFIIALSPPAALLHAWACSNQFSPLHAGPDYIQYIRAPLNVYIFKFLMIGTVIQTPTCLF